MNQEQLYSLKQEASLIERWKNQDEIDNKSKYIIDYINTTSKEEVSLAELSVGDGYFSTFLLKNVKNLKNINYSDISEFRLKQISDFIETEMSQYSKKVTLTQCNFDYDFEKIHSNYFDYVIAIDILEHVFDVFGFVEHCNRILVKGGVLFLRVPNIAYIKHIVNLILGRQVVTSSWFGKKGDFSSWKNKDGWDGGHLHNFTISSLFELLKIYNFKILHCNELSGRFSNLRQVNPNLFFANPLITAIKC